MSILVVIIHLIACIALIAIVLLQTGKGAEMGAAFGGASQTLFGGTGGSSFMSKLTTGAAVVFMITCLLLSYMYRPGAGRSRSLMNDIPVEQTEPQPPVPQQPAVPEARPVQPETAAPAAAPEASQKTTETPQQAPADVTTQQQAKPAPDTGVQTPAKAQPQHGQKKQDKAPAKKQ
jgi:preprotein translocase subunit SecG